MSLLVSLYAAILFFVLVPGILLTVPRKGGKYVVAAVHALAFGIIYYFTNKILNSTIEGNCTVKGKSCRASSYCCNHNCKDGHCV